jgi:hypothetical protein
MGQGLVNGASLICDHVNGVIKPHPDERQNNARVC